jgi:thioredoxin reductase (NADPH)
MDTAETFDVVIIGGGPAGLTASLYAARAMLKTLLIEKLGIGGLAASTHRIDNYPGFPEGIAGAELTQRMEEQARGFGVAIMSGGPSELELSSDPKLFTMRNQKIAAHTVIIASGTLPRQLNIPGEKELRGRGVSYCATCDGPFFRDVDLVVVGAGSSGLQESLFLLRFAKNIHIVEFLPQMTGERILQEKVKGEDRIHLHLNHQVVSIEGDQAVESVLIRDRSSGAETKLPAEGIFIYVGLIPNTDWLKGQVASDEAGYILTDENLATSVAGVFAAGDVRRKTLRQVATAVGDGALAAFMADRALNPGNNL